MADKKPLVNSAGNAVEIATGDTIGIANGGTGATTKGDAVANLLGISVTTANCANTTTETALLSATIPANTWANGEEISLLGVFSHRQFSGGSVNLTFKVKVNGTAVTTLSAAAVSNQTTVGATKGGAFFMRVGNDVYFSGNGTFGKFTNTRTFYSASITTNSFTGSNGNIWSGVDFTSDITLAITAQWSSANANTYFNTLVGKCEKT